MTKIIDILLNHDGDKPIISLEYFPPRSDVGVENLHSRMDRMKNVLNPAFTDMTWGAGGSTAELSLDLALHAQKTGHLANLHMTCTNLGENVDPKEAICKALQTAKDGGIRNIVALRGDPPAGETEWKATEGGFTCALDLVKFIREKFGDDFGISVAGYPEGHPNAITEIADPSTLTPAESARSSHFEGKTYCCLEADYEKEMVYLKQKVDAGADFIITQMFFDVNIFTTFVADCRKWGIQCPIVPGIMCINAYAGFRKMTQFCKTRVPQSLDEKMEAIKDDAEAVKEFGVTFGAEMCQGLIDSKTTPVLHFYTLNLEKVVYGILDKMGVTQNALSAADEADAHSQIAKGSAWARVGDKVSTPYGEGIVLEQIASSGMAKIQLSKWIMAEDQKPVAFLQKGQYTKIF